MKKCIHCLTEEGPFNDDHVFPSSWYPENTPAEIIRPTAPSCVDCNNKLSKIEENLLRVFSFGFSPNENGHKRIYERMKRSISASAGKNERDKKFRNETKRKFFRKFYPVSAFPRNSIVNPQDYKIEIDSLGIIFPVDELELFLKKISKGIIYNFGREKYVPSIFAYSFFHFQCPPIDLQNVPHVEKQYGPGFSFHYWEDPEFPPNAVIQIKIWQVLNFWITIENPILIPGEPI